MSLIGYYMVSIAVNAYYLTHLQTYLILFLIENIYPINLIFNFYYWLYRLMALQSVC